MKQQAIPEPVKYTAKLSGSENHAGFALWDAADHWIGDISPRDPDGIEGEAICKRIIAALQAAKGIPTENLAPGSVAKLVEAAQSCLLTNKQYAPKLLSYAEIHQRFNRLRAALKPFERGE